MPAPEMASPRLLFTPLSVADADEMVHVLSAASLYTFTGGSPPTLNELRARYTRQSAGHSPDGTQTWHNWILRTKPNTQAIGYVQATVMDNGHRAEVAWVIGAPWQGHGYATEAARTLITWLQTTGVTTIQAHIHPAHTASATVARRAGLLPTDQFDDGEQLWQHPTPTTT
ncbi:GNAT family N-acetyltransferase [Nonomuraea monospora]|uniref:GNAT family N-acetyltransferase n=1 Tax=Nonomuraea monospora TaxID=568818 RepID=A0ABN3D3Y7_9ACTN